MYFKSEFRKALSNKCIRICFFIFLAVSILSPLTIFLHDLRYSGFFEEYGAHPYQFWLLIDSATWGFRVYHTLFWIIPILMSGLIYQSEQSTSMEKLLLIRGRKRTYFFAKLLVPFLYTFAAFFLIFSLNTLFTYTIFSPDAPKTRDFFVFAPEPGSFAEPFFSKSSMCMAFVYAFLNALAQALFTVFVVALHQLFRFRNKYIAIVVPVILMYAYSYFFETTYALKCYSIKYVLQPLTSAIVNPPISAANMVGAFGLWFLVDGITVLAAWLRNRDVL